MPFQWLVWSSSSLNKRRSSLHAFVSGKDVFASLPTGFGKSYCYSLLPLVFDYIRAEGTVADLEQCSLVICILFLILSTQTPQTLQHHKLYRGQPWWAAATYYSHSHYAGTDRNSWLLLNQTVVTNCISLIRTRLFSFPDPSFPFPSSPFPAY